MNLYYYGVDNNLGGLENYAKVLLSGIRKLDPSIKIFIITEYDNMAYKGYFLSLGIDVITIPHKKHLLKYFHSIKKIVKNFKKGDALQLNIMSYRNSVLFKVIKKTNINIIVVGHGVSMEASVFSSILHAFNRFRFRKIGRKVAISKEVIPYMFKYSSNVKVINNVIDSSSFVFNVKNRIKIRNELRLSDDIFLIGQVGRLCKHKNQLFSLDIMKGLSKDFPNMKLVFLGANQNKKIYTKINNLKYANISYIGEKTNINEYYSAFDLLLFPSISEGSGLVVLEAIQNGCPVIASNNVPSIYANNYYSLPLDKDSWKKKVIDIFNNKNKMKRDKCVIKENSTMFINSFLEMYKM